jgi:dTDP-4-amino-4,6-dideoxygalactose transaminase
MIGRLRRQLPAHSPISHETVIAAIRGSLHSPVRSREALERALCDAYSARGALLVGSGTTALQLAISGIRAAGAAGPVALPAYSCYDVATAAEGADAKALLYDIDPATLVPEDQSLRRVLERAPSALVAAHLYGYPVDMDRVARLARNAGVVLIEDAAQGSGGRLRGRPLGSFGSLTVLSFGRGKGMTAGAGGALLARDDIGARVLAWAAARVGPMAGGLRDAVMLGVQWALGRPSAYWLPAALPFLHLGETVYHPPRPATAMSGAAMGALTLALGGRDAELPRRREVAERLLHHANRSPRVHSIEPVDGSVPGFLRLPLRVVQSSRADVLRELARHGAAPGYPSALTSLTPFAGRVLNGADAFDGARSLAETLLTFPTHAFVTGTDLAELERWLGARGGMEPRGQPEPGRDAAQRELPAR